MKCSNCGYYNNFSNKICNLCGTLLIPKAQIATENPVLTDFFHGNTEGYSGQRPENINREVLHPAIRNHPKKVKTSSSQSVNHYSSGTVTGIPSVSTQSAKDLSIPDPLVDNISAEKGNIPLMPQNTTVKNKICPQGHLNVGSNIFCDVCGEELFLMNQWDKSDKESMKDSEGNKGIWKEKETVKTISNWGLLKFATGGALGFAIGVYYGVKFL